MEEGEGGEVTYERHERTITLAAHQYFGLDKDRNVFITLPLSKYKILKYILLIATVVAVIFIIGLVFTGTSISFFKQKTGSMMLIIALGTRQYGIISLFAIFVCCACPVCIIYCVLASFLIFFFPPAYKVTFLSEQQVLWVESYREVICVKLFRKSVKIPYEAINTFMIREKEDYKKFGVKIEFFELFADVQSDGASSMYRVTPALYKEEAKYFAQHFMKKVTGQEQEESWREKSQDQI